MTGTSDPVRRTSPDGSLADRAYNALRDEIVTLHMRPGSLIVEEQLMKALQVGRTPLREALKRLEYDSLVDVLPRRGTLVSEINITDLAQISEIRVPLEGLAAALAAQRATTGDRSEAGELVAELDRVEGDAGPEVHIALDERAHHFVYRCAKNSYLEETLIRYYYLSVRMWFLVLERVSRLQASVQEHKELLLAIRNGDARRAQQIAQEHVLSFEAAIRQVI